MIARIKKELLDKIKSIINSTFLSYDTENEVVGQSYGKVRINTTNFSFEIFNIVSELEFPNEYGIDDVSCFSIQMSDGKKDFDPYIPNTATKRININEKIIKIELITDDVFILEQNYKASFDMALIIHTDKHSYTFSRDWFFSEVININVDKDFDNIYSIDQVKDSWSDDGDYTVEVSRHKTTL